jgi:hypothetical protein
MCGHVSVGLYSAEISSPVTVENAQLVTLMKIVGLKILVILIKSKTYSFALVLKAFL